MIEDSYENWEEYENKTGHRRIAILDPYDLSPKEMIANEVGLPMFDLEEAKHTHVHCSDDLDIECLVHSDGEIVDGMNLLVKINQPSQNIKDSYKLMISADYFDWVQEDK